MHKIDVNERIVGLERLYPTPRPTTSPFLEGRWNFEWIGYGSLGLFAARLLSDYLSRVVLVDATSLFLGIEENVRPLLMVLLSPYPTSSFAMSEILHGLCLFVCIILVMLIYTIKQAFPATLVNLCKMDWVIKDGYAKITANMKYLNAIENNFILTTKLTVEGPLRMKEEYTDGVLETPTVDEGSIPQQLKGVLGQAVNTMQQLPGPVKDAVSATLTNGFTIPLNGAFQRMLMISYLDEEILIIRDTSGAPEVLTRLDVALSPIDGIEEYES